MKPYLTMRSPGNSVLQAVYTALNGVISCNVYDDVPDAERLSMPYVEIGDITETNWDTQTFSGTEQTLTLHIWSRYRGKKECVDIANEILSALTSNELTLTDYFTISVLRLDIFQTMRDGDGITRHGVMRFRFQIQDLL